MLHKRMVPGGGALALLSLTLTLGCAGPNFALKQEKLVIVTIRDGKPYPSVNPVKLSYSAGEIAHWVFCGEGELTVEMKKESPFEKLIEHDGKHARSWKPLEKAIGKTFPYSITLKTGEGTFHYDPDVEVDK